MTSEEKKAIREWADTLDHEGCVKVYTLLAEVERLKAWAFTMSLQAGAARRLGTYKRELEGLTPGGSEFSDSPETCARFVRRYMEESIASAIRAIKEHDTAKALEKQLAEAAYIARIRFSALNGVVSADIWNDNYPAVHALDDALAAYEASQKEETNDNQR